MIKPLIALTYALFFTACSSSPAAPDNPAQIDRIVIVYAPTGDLQAADVQQTEIRDPAAVDTWLATLRAIPELPNKGVRMIRFLPNTPQHRVELYANGKLCDSHRLMGGQLDVAAHPGWAFYSGEDREFTELVTSVLPDA